MVFHKIGLLFLCCLLTTIAKGEVVKDCDLINQAKKYGAINPQLVLAIANVESSNNSKVIGRQDPHDIHYGLMQLKLETARMLGFRGHPKNLLQWQINLKYGVDYLNQKLRKHKSMQAAAAAYNAGAPYSCHKGRGCRKGSFVNQGYVNTVMSRYKKYNRTRCTKTT